MRKIWFLAAVLVGLCGWAGGGHAALSGAVCPGPSSLCQPLPALAPIVVHNTEGTTGCNAVNTTSCAATIPATGTGHTVLVSVRNCGLHATSCAATSGAYTVTVTDPASDICSLVSGADSGVGNGVRGEFFYCPSVTSGTTSFTATFSSAVDYAYIHVYELSGAIGTEAGSNSASGASLVSTITCSNTTTVANDLLFLNLTVGGGPTVTLGAPWSAYLANDEYGQAAGSAGNYSATPTWSGSDYAACAIVAVKP